jgi:hypothetical protein
MLTNTSPDVNSEKKTTKFSIILKQIWHLWALALGEKAHKKDQVADKVAVVRTVIFVTYFVTNAFIIAGVIRHWNDKEIKVQVEIYENQDYSEKLQSEGWDRVGVGRDSRIEGVYHSATVKNRTGEFE